MSILLIMSLTMVGGFMGIFYLGRKRSTPNIILWASFPLFRGLHWFIEYITDLVEESGEVLNIDNLEIALAIGSSCVLLAAALEFNGTIPRPWGKTVALFSAFFLLYFLIILPLDIITDIEDITLFDGFLLTSDPFRFLYGFLLPIISAIVLLITFFYRTHEVGKEGKVTIDTKLKRITLSLVILLVFFSFFEGLDYENDFFIAFRALTLTFFIIIPVLVIISSDLGLQHFFIIEDSGLLLFAYDFESKLRASDGTSDLTAGLLTALINFTADISETDSFLKIHSNNLYYIILKKENKIYALQSILYRKDLEIHFKGIVNRLNELLAETEPLKYGKLTIDVNKLNLLMESFSSKFQ